VRIERIELRLLRLPLVRFFETSFGRIYDRAFVLVTLEEGGVARVYTPKDFDLNRIMGEIADLLAERAATAPAPAA